MSLNTPVLYSAAPFDALQSYIFTFSYSGNQSVKNSLLIRNNTTLETVYEEIYTTFQLSHVLPAGILVNGQTYTAQIKVYDVNEDSSDYSTPIVFKCLTTPTFEIANIYDGQTVNAASVMLELNYSQKEGERLNNYQVYLYDSNLRQIFQSGILYDVGQLVYALEGLEDDASYSVRVTGQTISGFFVDTKYVSFTVEYISPDIFYVVEAKNDATSATVTVASNIIAIDGIHDGIPTYEDGRVNLLRGRPLIYKQGFEIGKDFSLQMKLDSFEINKPIAILGNYLEFYIRPANIYSEYVGAHYVQMIDKSGLCPYLLHSAYFASDKIVINIRRTDGLYNLEVIEVV